MSVIIKGMEMPETCGDCPLSALRMDCKLTGRDISHDWMKRKIPGWCPLVPLPAWHGELIERKALNLFPDFKEVRNGIKRTIKEAERDGRVITGVSIEFLKNTLVALDTLRSVRRYFLNAKTIVPAEGCGEDG